MKFGDLPVIRYFAGGRADGRARGRLMRDYFLVSVLLVGGGLIASGAIEIYYSFLESSENLADVQREVATGAAIKIERFIQEIHNTLKGATRSREIAPKGLTDEFRFELEKLLLIAPAITEAVALDRNGGIQVQASRLRTVLPDAKQKEAASAGAFQTAKSGKSFFGRAYFVRGSEPYMTVAVPIERFSGDVIGVLQAEVNLKYIGDVVNNLKIGKAGYAYVISKSGELIAHPDISLVLQRKNVVQMESTKVAFGQSSATQQQQRALITPNIQGKTVLSAAAIVPGFDWAIIIERPVQEAYEPVYASIVRTAALLLLGLGLALVASLYLARRVIRPVGILRQGVERIGAGELSHRLELKTGDEIEVLADEFNKMTAQLEESYSNLEQKVEDRTRELTESLEQQTATSEILGVISSSPTDVQPVFDTILTDALRICESHYGAIFRFDGEAFHHAATAKVSPELLAYLTNAPIKPGRETALRRVGLEHRTVHIPDVLADPEYELPEPYRKEGLRSVLAVPLLRENALIGAITIHRRDVKTFSEKQIALLNTFADQAVIAIENVRLFQELQARTGELARSVEELQALGEVGQAVSSTLDLDAVLTTIVSRAVQLSGTDGGIVYEYHEPTQEFLPVASQHIEEEFIAALRQEPIRFGQGAIGKAAVTRTTIQVHDIQNEQEYNAPGLRPVLKDLGYRSLLAVPLLREKGIIGGLVLLRRRPGDFSPALINLIETVATQSVLGIQNARLFREIEATNAQLEMASKHKSQFLANVSHELRTPLNSIIGFTRIVLRRSEGKLENLQKENLQKVLISSEHLLALINELLDLAKIESGRMEAYVETFKLDDILRVATTTVEPLLKTGRVKLLTVIAPDIPPLKTDRDKLKQSVLNLLSNAAKFTEQGEIKVAAWRDDGLLKLTVSDTGIGMKQEALQYIFDEFRQADMSSTRKYGGTGLGLAIVKKFILLMGGEIVVESEIGQGSKFTITLPMELKPPVEAAKA
jgi:signal transduction histidine kinase